VRIALGLEYDGAAHAGWQTQPSGQGVQDAVEAALTAIAGAPIASICAGRTDAGVHAIDQVIHFDTEADRPLTAWVRGANRFLPHSAAVRWARLVVSDFHARYSALCRTYEYIIVNEPVRAPLLHGRAGWVFRPLDVDAMAAAAGLLIGRHDFSSFRSAECQAASPVRELTELAVTREGRLIRVRARANAFLHHMVRNLVGALVHVGLNRRPPEWAGEVLAARDRSLSAPTFSAAGLYLTRVEYDQRFDLPAPADDPFDWLHANPNQGVRTDP
jgi:tRNA pseudouridine38-40 synthase